MKYSLGKPKPLRKLMTSVSIVRSHRFFLLLKEAQGQGAQVMDFINIPVSIVMGILLGLLTGYVLQAFFEWAYRRDHLIRNSVKVILVMAFAFLLLVVEEALEGVIAVSGLLAVVSMALMIRNRSVGVWISTKKTPLSVKERVFCVIS